MNDDAKQTVVHRNKNDGMMMDPHGKSRRSQKELFSFGPVEVFLIHRRRVIVYVPLCGSFLFLFYVYACVWA